MHLLKRIDVLCVILGLISLCCGSSIAAAILDKLPWLLK